MSELCVAKRSYLSAEALDNTYFNISLSHSEIFRWCCCHHLQLFYLFWVSYHMRNFGDVSISSNMGRNLVYCYVRMDVIKRFYSSAEALDSTYFNILLYRIFSVMLSSSLTSLLYDLFQVITLSYNPKL